ncbi:MAG: peptidoglycan-binding protein [Nodosilinea sp.]
MITTRWLAPICCTGLLLLGGGLGDGAGPFAALPGRAAPPAQTTTAAAGPLLAPGDQGSEVSQLQRELAETGFYAGPVDGLYGADTAEAVRSLQQRQGLEVDGIAGEQTWQALTTLNKDSTLTLPPPPLLPELLTFTPLMVAQPAPPPSALWLALMPLVPITGGALTYLQRRLWRRRAQRKRTLPR